LVLLVALVAVTFVSPGFFSGLLWGLYLSFLGFLYFFVSEPQQRRASVTTHASAVMTSNDIIFSISEELQQRKTAKNIVYKGWMNELRERYDPATYHVNQCQTIGRAIAANIATRAECTEARISYGQNVE
uniref:Pecanex-like protein n=1 Tax=Anisakis simplex TaxID=6269 RepID=A0A0M3JGS9_ANISI